MFTAIFLLLAVLMRKRTGTTVSLILAAMVDIFSNVAIMSFGQILTTYTYYTVVFLIVFAWWLAVCKLQLLYSQIAAGITTVFMSISVVDCYFSGGYETFLSVWFLPIMFIVNLFTIWAAWNDRDWISPISIFGRGKGSNTHGKTGDLC